jgi:hypothetical protein
MPQHITHRALIPIKALLIACVFSFAVAAQTRSATDGSTPLGLQPGSPAGSYALSGFDNVNLYNGNFEFSIVAVGCCGPGRSANACHATNLWQVACVRCRDTAT